MYETRERRRVRLARMLPHAPVIARAPGRVNLIGDHTDYQDGLCLPVAIDRDAMVAARPRDDNTWRVASTAFGDEVVVDLASPLESAGRGWAGGAAALVAALTEHGIKVPATDLAIASSVPVGSGLSSSAATNVAIALAVTHLAGTPLTGAALARVAQRAEHIAGVPCGMMDQMASVFGRAGHALLLDCRTLAVEAVPIPTDLSIIVVHSGLPRVLATSEYAARRAACEAAAARLGLTALRDATLDDVRDDPLARHVVSENSRVEAFAAALRANDASALGTLLDASHESLARDFGVSTPELDRLCDELRAAGAIGARLTGAGFGGCVVALAPADAAPGIAEEAAERYGAATALEPTAFVAQSADGASVLDRADKE